MSQETLDIITKERDQYKAIVEAIARLKDSKTCPVPAIECWTKGATCRVCLGEYARAEMEKINDKEKTNMDMPYLRLPVCL